MRYIAILFLIILPHVSVAGDIGYSQTPEGYVFDDKIKKHLPENYTICRSAFGSLNLDAYKDAVVILCHKAEATNGGSQRPLLIFTGTKGNKLKYRAQEKTSVLTSGDGGVLGDPLQNIEVKDGVFTINHYGGSNWRWTRNISFKYNKTEDHWFLEKVISNSYHINNPDRNTITETTVKDFGKLAFEDYSKLSAVVKQRKRKASYDCIKAGTPIEHAVCDSKHLGVADIKLAKLYRTLRKALPKADVKQLKKEQRSWIKTRNKNCQKDKKADLICLYKAYAERLVTLTKKQDVKYGKFNALDAEYARRSYAKNKNIFQDKAIFLAVSAFTGHRFFPDVKVDADLSNSSEVVFTYKNIQQHEVRNSDQEAREYFLLINNKGEMWYARGIYESFQSMFSAPLLLNWSNMGKEASEPESLKKWITRLRVNAAAFKN